MNPRYPIYIPSKGRYETRKTVKALDAISVPYRIVVEPQEYDKYAAVIDEHNILVLPEDNVKLIGARNWIKQHSISEGYERHWQLDDNIEQFNRLNRNYQVKVSSGTIFRCAEDFTDRYDNIAYSGFQYDHFAKAKTKMLPFILNTRVYSCTLVNNLAPYAWRSIYNDDTDVCLQALKDGWCTVLFNAFLQCKATTMTVKGGNTEELYLIEDGRKKMAQALVDLHPDVAKVAWRFNRWQHVVDYSSFKLNNRLQKKDGITIPEGINNYGMKLVTVDSDEYTRWEANKLL
jgi:hypothetical protein